MTITNKLNELIEYKILVNKRPELETEIHKLEKELDELDLLMDHTEILADYLQSDPETIEITLSDYYAKKDKLRINKSLILNRLNQKLLEFELNPYKK